MSIDFQAYFARPSETNQIETQRPHCGLKSISHVPKKNLVCPAHMAEAIIELERRSDSNCLCLATHITMMLVAVCDWNSRQHRLMRTEANRTKGESHASSPFPLGGYSALPRTARIPRPLEARPYGQAMPAQERILHLDLAVRRQQTLPLGMSYSTSLDRFKVRSCEVAARSHDGINHATMRSAAACDGDLRQRRLIWVGAAYRLAVAALLPPLTYVASSLGYELDRIVQELDNQGYQAQESIQPVHRQFTSFRGRRRCRLAGLTPLTYLHYSWSDSIIQTYVRFLLMRITFRQHGLIVSCDCLPHTKMPRENPRLAEALPVGKTTLIVSLTSPHRKAA